MVWQHDAARADANRARATSNVPDQHRRRGTGDARRAVVLSQPKAPVAESFGMLGERELRKEAEASLPSVMGARSRTESAMGMLLIGIRSGDVERLQLKNARRKLNGGFASLHRHLSLGRVGQWTDGIE